MKPKLFKFTENERAAEIKQYLPVNINLRFETLAPFLAACETKYLQPLIGRTLIDDLAAYYTDITQHDEESMMQGLLDISRAAVVRLALWSGFDTIAAQISDTGFSSAIEKDNRLYRYQEENLKRSLKEEGFDGLDAVMEYMEEHSNSIDHINTAPYRTGLTRSLVPTTKIFNQYYNINSSRLVFLKMRNYVRDVEELELCHRLGREFYNELLTANESVQKYADILPNLRCYVVYRAVADGIGELHKMPTEKGLLFETTVTGQSNGGVEEKPIEMAQMMETRAQFAQKAERYLETAISYIKDHRDDYPNYFLHAPNDPADGIIHRDNTNRKTFLA